jgi:uncharacterized membrane protein
MTHIEASVHINRPPEEVFAYMNDVTNDKAWNEGLIDSYADGPPKVGAKLTQVRTLLGQKMESVSEITAYEPPTRMAQRSIGGPVKFEGEVRFEPMGGGTHVTFSFEVEGAGVFKMAEGMFASQAKKTIEGDLERLKSVLES